MKRTCEVCGKEFNCGKGQERSPSSKTCSTICSEQKQRKRMCHWMHNFRKSHPMYQKEQLRILSERCLSERVELRKEIIYYLGSECVKCGFSDFRVFEIDHVKGHGCAERRKYNPLQYYRFVLSKILEGSEDYQLLCCNCNRIKITENRELHS